MAKSSDPVSRRVDGFVWLTRHARRTEIVSYVRGARDVPPEWLREDRAWAKVQRDRAIWKAAHPASGPQPSLREVAEACAALKVSYETVRNVLAVYADANGPKPRQDQERLKLRKFAKKAITRDVIDQFDRGELTAVDVAELIGNGADHRNAVYWLGRMRELYDKQDAGGATPKIKKKRKS